MLLCSDYSHSGTRKEHTKYDQYYAMSKAYSLRHTSMVKTLAFPPHYPSASKWKKNRRNGLQKETIGREG